MIELPNYRVAISSRSEGNPIVIIDINNYNIEKHIIEQGFVTGESSLCLLDSRSFLYVLNGKVIQISINNGYNIIYKSSNYEKLFGYGEMINITVTEGYNRYLIAQINLKELMLWHVFIEYLWIDFNIKISMYIYV